ncbi:hypothetical protein IT413_03370 [Candidatus Peregrinibacteria bacterium]|nr:hypothetical protein [Candidatus Peregrinibacteria bacterium]
MSGAHAEGHDAHAEHGTTAHKESNVDAVDDIFDGISKIASGVKKGVAGILGPLWKGLKKVGSFLEKKLGLASKGGHDAHSAHDAGHGAGHGGGHGEKHDDHGKGHDDSHGEKHDDHGDGHGDDHGKKDDHGGHGGGHH